MPWVGFGNQPSRCNRDHQDFGHIWVFPKIGVGPQNGWFIRENLINIDDLGVQLFLETPIFTLPETNSEFTPENRGHPKKETHLNQPQCFRCKLLVSGRVASGIPMNFFIWHWLGWGPHPTFFLKLHVSSFCESNISFIKLYVHRKRVKYILGCPPSQ